MASLESFMAGIRQVESGGNYSEPPNRVGASGAYQFVDSTWDNYGGYAHAYQAPPAVQDAKAAELMQSYYDSFGDWDHVAAAWIGGPGTAEKGPDAWAHIDDGNITVEEYVRRVNAAMGAEGAASSVASAATGAATVAAAAAPDHPATAGAVLGATAGLLSGKPLTDNPALQATSTAGDTLGSRLQQIMHIINGGPSGG